MYDLLSAVLVMRATHQAAIPAYTGYAAEAWFLKLLNSLHPALAESLHQQNKLKPFTLSSLITDSPPRDGLVEIKRDQLCHLRITAVHADLARLMFTTVLPTITRQGVNVHEQQFTVESIQVKTESDDAFSACWAGRSSYQILHEAWKTQPPPQYLELVFESPTSFKRTGGTQIPLPLPELVFRNLAERWKQYSPIPLHDDLADYIAQQVILVEHNIRTAHVPLGRAGKGNVTGFHGQATFSFFEKDPALQREVGMLAVYALWAGVGVKASMGLGQTRLRRIE